MAQLADWLGPFLEQELRAVTTWRQNINEAPQVKRDPDGRFVDDGSNLKCDISTSHLPGDSRVQISEVLSTEEPVTVLVTDGFTHVKAKLSEESVTSLEAELEEEINLDTKGDVISIRGMTLVSTPIGVPDENIQLEIEEIRYEYHRRKKIGQPKPIQDRAEAKRLIDEIPKLWLSGADDPYSVDAAVGASREDQPDSPEGDTPKSQRSAPRSQASPGVTQQSFNTQVQVATQVPRRKKPPQPTLSEDGFEVAQGANLARPVPPDFTTSASSRAAKARETRSAGHAITNQQLRGLLGKMKPEEPQLTQEPTARRCESSHSVTQPQTASIQPQRASQQTKSTKPDEIVAEASPPSAQPTSTVESTRKTPRKDYSRRRIPQNQQKLLDRPESWLPSLPGKQFPHPNVPIELLEQWRDQVTAKNSHVLPSGKPDNATAALKPDADERGAESSGPSSTDESSDDEELPPSQWPPSPSQRKPALPPDSTMNSTSRPSPKREQAEFPPDGSNENRRRAASAHRENTNGQSSNPGAGQTPHSLPRRPSWIPPDLDKWEPPQTARSQKGSTSRPGSSHKRSADQTPRRQKRPRQQIDGAAGSPPSSSGLQRTTDRALPTATPPVATATPADRNHPRSSANNSPSTVVKGTQSQDPDDGDMDMEMSVPRSLDQDPRFAHRERRKEHFRPAQRRNWIKQNYIPDPTSSHHRNLETMFTSYRRAHPSDELTATDFVKAIEEVYPGADSDSLKLKSPKKEENVASTPQLQRAPTTDAEGAVEIPGEVSSGARAGHVKQRVVEARTQSPSSSVFARFAGSKPSAPPTSSARRLPWSADSTPREGATSSRVPESVVQQRGDGRRNTATPSKLSTVNSPLSLSGHPRVKESAGLGNNPTNKQTIDDSIEPSRHVSGPTATPNGAPQERQVPSGASKKTNRGDNDEMMPDAFLEYALRWKEIRPGGAFAEAEKKKEDDGNRSARKRRRLNVLGWEL